MGSYDKKVLEISCPGCQRPIEPTYYDLHSRREAKCKRCGSAYKISSSSASRFRQALQNMEQANKKLKDAISGLFKDADITIKKR